MAYLKKEDILFERKDGKLIPQTVKLIGTEEEISATPMTRGEIKEMWGKFSNGITDADFDKKIILEHCFEPKFTEEEIDGMKSIYATLIVNTILKNSGITINKEEREVSDELKK